jgi:UDP-N-acetyl-2-amino-2-deoxyglucuronate dehydrogenase
MSRTNYALIGVGGYIAPRHLEAIKKTGGTLRAAVDPKDSVGIIDHHFPEARFFVDFEQFAEYIACLKGTPEEINYVSICSPNYLHKSHISFALRAGANVICEKPLVLEPGDVEDLAAIEKSAGRKINAILQLRLHPAIIELQKKIRDEKDGRVWDVDLTYITSRGQWYYVSWKGDDFKSGGITTNIGVHLYDMLGFVFGRPTASFVHYHARDCAAGFLQYDKARVRWFLSINRRDMTANDGFAQRCMTIQDFGYFDFSKGFENLHTISYERIVAGSGFPLADTRLSIETVANIRKAPLAPDKGTPHPLLAEVLADTSRYRAGLPA